LVTSSGSNVENCDELAAYNHTELYQLCRRAGLKVTPDMPKGTLMSVLEGEVEAHLENPLDELRDGLMGFILEHWKRLSVQLFCPAKSGDPKACFQCVDAQVIHCLTINPRIEPGVYALIRRKNESASR
jgi:hypothetical protein